MDSLLKILKCVAALSCLLAGVIPRPCSVFALDPSKNINQYVLDEWTTGKGLPQNSILSIAQTPDGYLWLATTNGLVRFDGRMFTTFNTRNTREIKNDRIQTLYVDRQGCLWIGTEYGDLIQYQKGKFNIFSAETQPSSRIIFSLLEDIQGRLWIGTYGRGLNLLKDGMIQPFSQKETDNAMSIYDLYEDSKGNIWVGTQDGLYFVDNDQLRPYMIKGIGNHFKVRHIYEDKNDALWIGTNLGLIRIRNKHSQVFSRKQGLCNNYINSFTEDRDHNIWVATPGGINRIKKANNSDYVAEKFLEDQVIYTIFEDREGSLWLGTMGAGLKRLRDGKFVTYTMTEGLINNCVTSILEGRHHNIWVGTVTGVVRVKNGQFTNITKEDKFLDSHITALAAGPEECVWVGTDGDGVFRIKKEQLMNVTVAHGLAGNTVRAMIMDSRKNLWIGTNDGLTRITGETFTSFTTADGLPNNVICDIFEDRNQTLWIGTLNGITVYRNGEFSAYRPGEGQITGTSFSIHEDSLGVLWIGTYGAGLVRLENDIAFSITTQHGLQGNTIFQILEDNHANLWMSGDKGLFMVAGKDLNDLAAGGISRFQSTVFGISDGLKSVESDILMSGIKSHDGKLWFPTLKGVSVINPETIKLNKFPPPVIIEKIIVDGELLDMGSGDPILRNPENIVFHFTANTFISPEKIMFKTMLEGLDGNWKFIRGDDDRFVAYENLESGEYGFRVLACNSDGIWNLEGAVFRFRVLLPFYKGVWFKVFMFLLLLALALAACFSYKTVKKNLKNRRRYKMSSLSEDRARESLKKLMELMEIRKVYRLEHVSLTSLAEQLSITPHNLSQIINEHLRENFNSFINRFRIEEAKEKFEDPNYRDVTILEIAMDVGFNSKAVFNRAFKKKTKMTPSEYRKKHASRHVK